MESCVCINDEEFSNIVWRGINSPFKRGEVYSYTKHSFTKNQFNSSVSPSGDGDIKFYCVFTLTTIKFK